MNAEELLRAGEPDKALAELQQIVRAQPAKAELRVFLFQLLAVLGQWDRALTQLGVAGELDDGCLAMVQVYRELLRQEVLREQVFAGERSPLVFGEPTEWLALLLEALRGEAGGQVKEAAELRARALDLAPTTPGTADGEAFEWIADGDSRLGPVLELMLQGRYYWVPFDRIRSLEIGEPEDLRDMVWCPAQLVWSNGGEAIGFIPSRYPGSAGAEDPLLGLARKTDWVETGEGSYHGLGQRMLVTNAGEYPLLALRNLQLETASEEA